MAQIPLSKTAGESNQVTVTRYLKDTLKARIERDSGFREALFEEAVERLLAGEFDRLRAGEFDIGKSVLRDYANATVRFQELGALTAKSPKSLLRMLGPQGNPQARNLLEIIAHLQELEGVKLKVTATR